MMIRLRTLTSTSGNGLPPHRTAAAVVDDLRGCRCTAATHRTGARDLAGGAAHVYGFGDLGFGGELQQERKRSC